MALGAAPNLLMIAQSGERKLTSAERRLVVHYLQRTAPAVTNVEMATWFKCDEKLIRNDLQAIRTAKAKFLKEELARDMSLVIADIQSDFEQQVSDIEKDKEKARPGSRAYLDHCKAIFDMRLQMISAYQGMGYLPKNLGSMTQNKFEYKAIVHKDGSLNTRSVTQFDEVEKAKIIDAEVVDPSKQLPAPEQHSEEMKAIIAETEDTGQ